MTKGPTRYYGPREHAARRWLPGLLAELGARYHTTGAAILSPSQEPAPRTARLVAYWVLREAGLSLPGVGRLMGRDHSTVLSGCRRVEATPDLEAVAWELADVFARTAPIPLRESA